MIDTWPDALALAGAIRAKKQSARDAVAQSLEHIHVGSRATADGGDLNHFISSFADDAQSQAEAIDDAVASAEAPGALAGVPFAVKDLFDVQGHTTRAGSIALGDNPPATQDATAVAALRAAGAIPVGTTNMDELAFGFTTENSHFGPARNPHDPTRSCGGSSGGSAATVAAGHVPVALGSDTNGSVRVPAALCGVYGMKPTYGRISRAGAVPLAWSFDHVGWFARTLRDIAAIFDVIQIPDDRDPVQTGAARVDAAAAIGQRASGLRIATAGGHFATGGHPEVFDAAARVASVLGAAGDIELAGAEKAVAASLLITSCEAASLHTAIIRIRPQDLDPHTRDRWIAAAMLPSLWYQEAQRFRRRFRETVLGIFKEIDVLIAPTTPFAAPALGQGRIEIDGSEVPVRGTLGRFVAPFSFIGLPVLSVPIKRERALPLGVQLIAAPNNETAVLKAAAALAAEGITEDTPA